MDALVQPTAAIGHRPPSATSTGTTIAGFVGAIAALFAVGGLSLPLYQKTLLVIAITAAAMLAVDVGVLKTFRNPSSGLSPTPLREASFERTIRKVIGFTATVGILTFLYWLLPEYGGNLFDPIRSAAGLCLAPLVVLSPLYIIYVDRRQRDPEDAMAQIGSLVVAGTVPDRVLIGQFARGWMVKGFFLPLMFIYLAGDLDGMWKRFAAGPPVGFTQWYDTLYDLLFLGDVLYASIGYIATFRVLDTHIRSTEPTVFGWAVCLICYEPFSAVIDRAYIQYETDNLYWGGFFADWPLAYAIWGSVILLLVFIYTWSTASFGLRFSNLTHRGIITNGPYRWLKHPAYVSKNLSWWLISIPFLSNAGWIAGLKQSLLLLALNGVYALRAYTEERHLSFDSDYRAYREYIRTHGLVARVMRIFRARTSAQPRI